MIRDIGTCKRKFVSPKDFAMYLTVPVRTVYAWIEKGAIHAWKFEGTVRIPIDEARRVASLHAREQVSIIVPVNRSLSTH